MRSAPAEETKNPLREIVDPFVDLFRASRAIQALNWPYLIEGFAYFGVVGYLAMYFNKHVGLGDVQAGYMVGTLTWGITIAMFFLGGLADRWGVRAALLLAFVSMALGRTLLAVGPHSGLAGGSLVSPLSGVALLGILLVVTGYGMYQPAAYAGVRQFTTEKTSGMAYAMLYALMNLGGWLPTWFTPVRKTFGITGAYAVIVGCTLLALALTFVLLTGKVQQRAIESARAQREREAGEKRVQAGGSADEPAAEPAAARPGGVMDWLRNHPFTDAKFSFFIFCLIPVQTLFAHNWLTLPMYVERAYRDSWPWISDNFEKAVNFNPLLIFILVPIVTALTQKRKVYNMMIVGTLVMAAPAFLLVLGPRWWTLVPYLIIMTVGEAMWQPRFLQYAAEIAPEGRTGTYMGVAQFPWFMTKVAVSLYSGWFLENFCPARGATDTRTMWLIYAVIAMSSTLLLVLARGWLGKDFKTRAD